MTVLEMISNKDEAPSREEIQTLVAWCHDNHLNFNTKNTKEIIDLLID